MGAFECIIQLAAENYCIIICIDVVLTIGCVEFPKFFYAFSETVKDVVNALLHT